LQVFFGDGLPDLHFKSFEGRIESLTGSYIVSYRARRSIERLPDAWRSLALSKQEAPGMCGCDL